MTTYVPLKNGGTAVIDDVDRERVMAHSWRASSNGRKNTYVRRCGGGSPVYLHRFVTDAPPGALVDHVNGDGLDNRRMNLRLADHAGNAANQRTASRGTSRYRGVYWNARLRKWHAQIGGGSTTTYIGVFDDEAEAGRAYDRAALARFGEFAVLNFEREIAL